MNDRRSSFLTDASLTVLPGILQPQIPRPQSRSVAQASACGSPKSPAAMLRFSFALVVVRSVMQPPESRCGQHPASQAEACATKAASRTASPQPHCGVSSLRFTELRSLRYRRPIRAPLERKMGCVLNGANCFKPCLLLSGGASSLVETNSPPRRRQPRSQPRSQRSRLPLLGPLFTMGSLEERKWKK